MGKGGGVATGAGVKPGVTLKLAQLQNLCKRDPAGYREDYDAQVRRLRSECGILALSTTALTDKAAAASLVELIQFAAAVSSASYKGEESDAIANLLIELLIGPNTNTTSMSSSTNNHIEEGSLTINAATLQLLHKDVRKAATSGLILMRNKGAIKPLRLLELFYRIMTVVTDKNLREALYHHMVNDIANMNKKGKREEKVNRAVQSFLHGIIASSCADNASVEGPDDVAARRGVDMVCELYRKGVWTDEKTVAILASAVQSRNSHAMCRALRFFLNIEDKMAADKDREEDEEWNGANDVNLHRYSKRTKSRQRQIMKSLKNKTKAQKKKESKDAFQMASSGQGYIEDKGVAAARKLYPAIELLNDPQGLVESLFKRIRSSGSNTYKFDVKLLMINFVTRLVGNHELILLPLYPFLQRYMGGHQRDVTAILAYTVQACHEYVPPDEVYGILKTIAHNFITERCSGEQMAVGINAVRSICARVPSVLSLEDNVTDDNNMTSVAMDVEAFARDLAAYSKHNDRSVSIAGRTWGNFVRDVHPSLLQGKDRGATGSALHRAGEKPLRYGEQRVASGVAGADLLAEYEANKATYLIEKQKRRDAGEESESDDDDDDDDDGIEGDDDSGGWVDVDGDEEMEGEDEESDDEVAPELVPMKEGVDGKMVPDQKKSIDLSKMSTEERSKLKQDVSSGRVFTASDFATMKRLVEREEKLKRDPRAAARRKRAIAKGKGFEILSDDDGSDVDSDDEDGPTITGVVNPEDIMAMAKRKRMNKAERLQKIIAGREKFESKGRAGGSTNNEKKRKKNFLMTKQSFASREKLGNKATARQAMNHKIPGNNRDAKKRRRKL